MLAFCVETASCDASLQESFVKQKIWISICFHLNSRSLQCRVYTLSSFSSGTGDWRWRW